MKILKCALFCLVLICKLGVAEESPSRYGSFSIDLRFPDKTYEADKDREKSLGYEVYEFLPDKIKKYGKDVFFNSALVSIELYGSRLAVLSDLSVFQIDGTYQTSSAFPGYPNQIRNSDKRALMIFDKNNKTFQYSKYPVRRGGPLDLLDRDDWRCLSRSTLAVQDIDFDGVEEMFIFGGGGGSRGGVVNRWIDFYIFDQQRMTPIFYSLGLFESYDLNENSEYVPGTVDGVLYQSVTNPYFYKDEDSSRRRIGVKSDTKYFFGDYDLDDKLDIIVWRKSLKSRRADDPLKDFELSEESLSYYSLGHNGFEPLHYTLIEIKEFMGKHSLSWKDGFPKSNSCD